MLDKIVLGTAQFGMRYGINSRRKISKNEIFKILDFSVENQINKLDTAPVYGNAEELIGEYSKINDYNFKITSKIDTKNKSIREKSKSNEVTKYQINIEIVVKYGNNSNERFSVSNTGVYNVSTQHSFTLTNEKKLIKLLSDDLAEEIINGLVQRFNDI